MYKVVAKNRDVGSLLADTPYFSSSPKQKFTRGIQLVNLTFGTLTAVSSGSRGTSWLKRSETVSTVSEPID